MVSRTVVMTRRPEQAGAVEAGLAVAGHRIAYLPLTDFELPEDPGPLRAAVACLSGNPTHDAGPPTGARPAPGGGRQRADAPGWLVLTSPNTVRALVLSGWDGRVGPGTRIAVTGPGTARVLADAGCPETPWMPVGDASAAGIVAQFPAPDSGPGAASRRVLLPQSSLAASEVADGIAHRGWDVDRVEAYRTVPFPAAPGRCLLTADDAAAGEPASALVSIGELAGADIVLTSPSAVSELVRRRGTSRPEGTRFIAIGQPTARAAHAAGLTLAGTSRSPDAEGLLAVLVAG